MRLVFLGDSLTWGKYGGSFVDRVAELLSDHEIINAGVGGNTVINLLDRLDMVLQKAPDGIFVMVGGNDAISYSQPGVSEYYRLTRGAPDGQITPDLFARTYRELLTQIQLEQVLTWVGLETTEYSPALLETFGQFNQLVRDVARSLNAPMLDLGDYFQASSIPERPDLTEDHIALIGKRAQMGWADYEHERRRGGFTYTFDGLHFTPESAYRAGKLIADFLRPYVSGR
jgi:lysophospholipase L1-like esterase